MACVALDIAAHFSGLIFKPTRRGVESVTDGDVDILMGLVDRLGPIDHDVFARHTDVDPHAVELALVVMSMRCLHHHRAADNAVVETFELRRLLADALLDGGGGGPFVKTDFQRNLHSETSPSLHASSCQP